MPIIHSPIFQFRSLTRVYVCKFVICYIYGSTQADVQLLREVVRHDLLVDRLLLIDIKTICDQDDNYFIFQVGLAWPAPLLIRQSVIRDVLLAFLRDGSVPALVHPGAGCVTMLFPNCCFQSCHVIILLLYLGLSTPAL